MAEIHQSRFVQLPAVFLFYFLLIFSSATTYSVPSLPPTADYNLNYNELTKLPSILLASTLGFQELTSVVVAANISNNTPLDHHNLYSHQQTLLCSTVLPAPLPLLLKEHSVPGIYPLRFLRDLAFGSKIETLADGYCLTITTSNEGEDSKAIFVNGAPITSPDLFNNGIIIIRIHGFVSHLSPLSCNIERATTLSFIQPTSPYKLPLSAPFSMMRLLLNDAVIRLRHSGYNLLALAP